MSRTFEVGINVGVNAAKAKAGAAEAAAAVAGARKEVEKLRDAATEVAKVDPYEKITGKIGGLQGRIEQLGGVLGKVGGLFGKSGEDAANGLGKIGDALDNATAGANKTKGIIDELITLFPRLGGLAVGPFAAITIGVGAAIGAVQVLKEQTVELGDETFTYGEIAGGVWEGVKDAAAGAWYDIKKATVEWAKDFISKTDDASKTGEGFWGGLVKTARETWNDIVEASKIAVNGVIGIVLTIGQVGGTVAASLVTTIGAAFENLATGAATIWDALKSGDFKGAAQAIGATLSRGLDIVRGEATRLSGEVKGIVVKNFTTDFAGQITRSIVSGVKGAITGVRDFGVKNVRTANDLAAAKIAQDALFANDGADGNKPGKAAKPASIAAAKEDPTENALRQARLQTAATYEALETANLKGELDIRRRLIDEQANAGVLTAIDAANRRLEIDSAFFAQQRKGLETQAGLLETALREVEEAKSAAFYADDKIGINKAEIEKLKVLGQIANVQKGIVELRNQEGAAVDATAAKIKDALDAETKARIERNFAQAAFQKSLDEEAETIAFETGLIGKTRDEIIRANTERRFALQIEKELLNVAKLRAQLEAGLYKGTDGFDRLIDQIDDADAKIAGLIKQGPRVADALINKAQLEEKAENFKGFVGTVKGLWEGAGAAFARDGFKGMKDFFKQTLAEWKTTIVKMAFQLAAQKFVAPVLAQIGTSIGLPNAQGLVNQIFGLDKNGGGGAGNFLSQLLGSAGNGQGGGSGLVGAISTTFPSLTSSLKSLLPSLGSLTGALSSLGPILGAVGLATGLNKALSGGYSVFKGSDGLAGSLLGGGIIAPIINRLFGRKLADSGVTANISGSGEVSGDSFQFLKGGVFRSDKTLKTPLDAETTGQIKNASGAVFGELRNYATALGVTAKGLDNFNFNLKISTKGLTPEQIQEKFQAEFGRLAKESAQSVFAGTEFANAAAELSGTADEVNRTIQSWIGIKAQLTLVNEAIPSLGATFDQLRSLSEGARQSLTAYAGGIQALQQYQTANRDATLDQARAQATLTGRYTAVTATLRDLIASNDGSVASLGKIVTATQARYDLELQLIGAIRDQLQITKNEAAGLKDQFTLATLDKTGQYEFLDNKADGLLAQLELERDPATIASLRTSLNNVLSQAFNLLDPAQQKEKLGDYLNRVDVIDTTATNSLNAADKTIRDDFDPNNPDSTAARLGSVIKTAAEEAGEILKAAATEAATKLVEGLPKRVDIDVDIRDIRVPDGFAADVNVTTAYQTGAGGQ